METFAALTFALAPIGLLIALLMAYRSARTYRKAWLKAYDSRTPTPPAISCKCGTIQRTRALFCHHCGSGDPDRPCGFCGKKGHYSWQCRYL